MMMVKGTLKASRTFLQLRHLAAIIRPAPVTAVSTIGTQPSAAGTMMAAMIPTAALARPARGSSTTRPSTSIADSVARRRISARDACTSNTSPVFSRAFSRSCVGASRAPARWMASGTSP